MEQITVYSTLTKTVAQSSALCVSLTLASVPLLQANWSSKVTKSLTTGSKIDLEES